MPATKFEHAFTVYRERFERLTEYLTTVSDGLVQNRTVLPLFVESTIVLLVAWYEDFLVSVVATAVREKQSEFRSYLQRAGNPSEKASALSCDLRALIGFARARISFKKRGDRLERLFQVLFGFSPWPDDNVRNRLVDLNLLRQLIVHHGGASVGDEHFEQFADKSLLRTTQYAGAPAIRRLDHMGVLVGLQSMLPAMSTQVSYLLGEFVKRPEWLA